MAALPPWHTACRADVVLVPDTIAGILDGDGSLYLAARRGKRHVPAVSLTLRDDDPTTIAVARSLAAYLGRSIGLVGCWGGRHVWRVASVADVAALLRFLARHPLLSPRGARQQAALAEAVAILQASRTRGGRAPLREGEREHLAALAARIGRRRAENPLPLPEVARAAGDRQLGDYFTGLVATEGCLEARSSRTHHVRPAFRLTQRIDNFALLELLRERLGIGDIVRVSVRVGSPAFQLVVQRGEDVDALVRLLRAHPLPASSPKAGQFDAWVELIALRRGILTLGTRGDLARSSTLAAVAGEIRAAKRYAGHQELCTCRARGAAADAGSGT